MKPNNFKNDYNYTLNKNLLCHEEWIKIIFDIALVLSATNLDIFWVFKTISPGNPEAFHRCCRKGFFQKVLDSSQEKTFSQIYFVIKVQASYGQLY